MLFRSGSLLLGCLPLLLSGCSSEPETPPEAAPGVLEQALTKPDVALFRGVYTVPFDAAALQPGEVSDLLRSSDPLVRRLLGTRRIRPDALRLGLDIDRDGHIVDAAGKASEHILAIGPMTRGDLWEVVAVPDIRNQVSALARRLVNAHWTGGEGL